MRFIAPAGTPLGIADLWELTAAVRGRKPQRQLEQYLVAHAGREICLPMSSGRAAMVLILQCMKRVAGPHRNLVVIPAYTCYSVLAAVENAGLRAVLCDIDPGTLDPDIEQLSTMNMDQVLCIVTANLYGIPNGLSSIESLARDRGVFMLDDSAQSLGARYDGRPVGGFGDAGLYSFDKGKNIATMQGGAIVAKPGALGRELCTAWSGLPSATARETTANVLKLVAYAVLLRPQLYGLVQRLPGLGLGLTRYETLYPRTRYSAVLAGVAVRQLLRFEEITATRVRNASRIEAALVGSSVVSAVKVNSRANAVYLRYPVLVSSPGHRTDLLRALEAAGIGATGSYPQSLADLPAAQRLVDQRKSRADGARQVARTILTLPTHAYCDEAAIRAIKRILAA